MSLPPPRSCFTKLPVNAVSGNALFLLKRRDDFRGRGGKRAAAILAPFASLGSRGWHISTFLFTGKEDFSLPRTPFLFQEKRNTFGIGLDTAACSPTARFAAPCTKKQQSAEIIRRLLKCTGILYFMARHALKRTGRSNLKLRDCSPVSFLSSLTRKHLKSNHSPVPDVSPMPSS